MRWNVQLRPEVLTHSTSTNKRIKFKDKNCDVNNLNQCCYETLAAFSGYIKDPEKAKSNCVTCINDKLESMGTNYCDLRNFMSSKDFEREVQK